MASKHTTRTSFQVGTSGNPGGRPKKDERHRRIEDIAREHSEEAIQALVEIANNSEAGERARVAAAEAILDRGWGTPVQRIETGTPGEFEDKPTEQLLAEVRAEREALAAMDKAEASSKKVSKKPA